MNKNQIHRQYTIRWTEIHAEGARWDRYFLVDASQKQEMDRAYRAIEPVLKRMSKVSGTRFEYGGAILLPEQNRKIMDMCANTDYIEGKARYSFCNVNIKNFTELEGKNYDQIYNSLYNLRWIGGKYENQSHKTSTRVKQPRQTKETSPTQRLKKQE